MPNVFFLIFWDKTDNFELGWVEKRAWLIEI